jgi:hypothetical protein
MAEFGVPKYNIPILPNGDLQHDHKLSKCEYTITFKELAWLVYRQTH